jgi:peroxiredoxin
MPHILIASLLRPAGRRCEPHGAADAPAPDFTLKTLAGPALRLAEQRGQVVLVNFWASWCGPARWRCRTSTRLHDKYRGAGVVLLGVNVDDDPKRPWPTEAHKGIRFPVLLDTDKTVVRRYKLGSMPTTVLIDRDGRVRHVHQGYRTGYDTTYDAQIRALVKE